MYANVYANWYANLYANVLPWVIGAKGEAADRRRGEEEAKSGDRAAVVVKAHLGVALS